MDRFSNWQAGGSDFIISVLPWSCSLCDWLWHLPKLGQVHTSVGACQNAQHTQDAVFCAWALYGLCVNKGGEGGREGGREGRGGRRGE